MNVLEIPFNKFIELKKAEKDDFILKLEEKKEFLNHLGTFHAGILFTLAEATSGEFLLKKFKKFKLNVIPVVRKVDIKYSKPGNGTAYSKADFADSTVDEIMEKLVDKKRLIIKVRVDIYDESSNRLLSAIFDWFIILN